MLISISVENFRSIRDRQTLVLEASIDDSLESSHVCKTGSGLRLLKGAAIYGANASGKSNVLAALTWMRQQVVASPSESLQDASILTEPFRLSSETRDAPSVFEVEILIGEDRYRYGFAVTEKRVVEEWLWRRKPGASKAARLFTREGDVIDPNTNQMKGAADLVSKSRTRPDVLFLTVCATWNVEIGEILIDWFRKLRFSSGLHDRGFFDLTAKLLQDAEKREQILRFATKAEMGMLGLSSEIRPIDGTKLSGVTGSLVKRLFGEGEMITTKIKTKHEVFDKKGDVIGTEEFDLSKQGSQGSQKFIALAGPLLEILEEGSVLVMDEFEARLHPRLTRELLKFFLGRANKSGAQFIIATHDTGLMVPDLLRRDQIWFTEKDERAGTSLYCLDEFDSKKVRPSTKFNRQYLLGIFGAVPKLALDEF